MTSEQIGKESAFDKTTRELNEKSPEQLFDDLANTSESVMGLAMKHPELMEDFDKELTSIRGAEKKQAEEEARNTSSNAWINRLEQPHEPTTQEIKEVSITNQAIKIIESMCNECLAIENATVRHKKIAACYDRYLSAFHGIEALLDLKTDLADAPMQSLVEFMVSQNEHVAGKENYLDQTKDVDIEKIKQRIAELDNMERRLQHATDLSVVTKELLDEDTIKNVLGKDANLDALKVKGFASALLYGIKKLSPELKQGKE